MGSIGDGIRAGNKSATVDKPSPSFGIMSTASQRYNAPPDVSRTTLAVATNLGHCPDENAVRSGGEKLDAAKNVFRLSCVFVTCSVYQPFCSALFLPDVLVDDALEMPDTDLLIIAQRQPVLRTGLKTFLLEDEIVRILVEDRPEPGVHARGFCK